MNDQITTEQLAVIEQQLGRTPRGIVEIAYQTEQGLPVVLRMASLVDDKPFPTLYWLCSKDLHKAINKIETAGWVKQIEQELQDNAELRQRYLSNHQDYVAQRDRWITAEQRQRIEQLGFSELFKRYGIGGIAQWDKVRCLHMHYAHYLCSRDNNPNVIGERMEQQFELSKLPLSL